MDKAGIFKTICIENETDSDKLLNGLHKNCYVKVLTTCTDAEGNIIHTLYLKVRPESTNIDIDESLKQP